MGEREDHAEETDGIPPELKPPSGPDLQSVDEIVRGAALIVMSVATWELSVEMEPTVVGVWNRLFPVAPFGQLFPRFLTGPLDSILSFSLEFGDLHSVPILLGLFAPLLFVIGFLTISYGTAWTALEYVRSVRQT